MGRFRGLRFSRCAETAQQPCCRNRMPFEYSGTSRRPPSRSVMAGKKRGCCQPVSDTKRRMRKASSLSSVPIFQISFPISLETHDSKDISLRCRTKDDAARSIRDRRFSSHPRPFPGAATHRYRSTPPRGLPDGCISSGNPPTCTSRPLKREASYRNPDRHRAQSSQRESGPN